jgi:hypothetical protein
VVSIPPEPREDRGNARIVVHGPLVADGARVLAQLADLRSPLRLTLDLSSATEVDRAGLSAIAEVHGRLAAAGGELCVMAGRRTDGALTPLRSGLGGAPAP